MTDELDIDKPIPPASILFESEGPGSVNSVVRVSGIQILRIASKHSNIRRKGFHFMMEEAGWSSDDGGKRTLMNVVASMGVEPLPTFDFAIGQRTKHQTHIMSARLERKLVNHPNGEPPTKPTIQLSVCETIHASGEESRTSIGWIELIHLLINITPEERAAICARKPF